MNAYLGLHRALEFITAYTLQFNGEDSLGNI